MTEGPANPEERQRNLVLSFLASIGRRDEAELYLEHFRRHRNHGFALIGVEGALLDDVHDSLRPSLRLLAALGLPAPIALGYDGGVDRPAARRAAERLRASGIGAQLVDGSLAVEKLSTAMYAVLKTGGFPVAACQPRDGLGGLADVWQAVASRKLVLIRHDGGIKTARATPSGKTRTERIDIINLETDLTALTSTGALSRSDSDLLGALRPLMRGMPNNPVASVTSPLNVMRELFTVAGAGTLLKLGTRVISATEYASIDLDRLRQLLLESFQRPVAQRFFDRTPMAIYVAGDYRGAAIVESGTVGAFLTKFAVRPVAQGEGVGRDLWTAVTGAHPKLYWRARTHNPIAAWYRKQCDGCQRAERYTVFWRGAASYELPNLIDDALQRPADFSATG